MAKATDNNTLRIYTEQPPEVTEPGLDSLVSLPPLLGAFEQSTGWSLRYVPDATKGRPDGSKWSAPVNPGVGIPPGHFELEPVDNLAASDAPKAPVDRTDAQAMASALSQTVGELLETRQALWQREAELAAGVPLIPHPEEQQHLATRLEAVLRAGAEAVDAQAAALYLLDEATTELKLRSAWGLPFNRLVDGPRPLKGAVADLEALLGHAVVLSEPGMAQTWRVLEERKVCCQS